MSDLNDDGDDIGLLEIDLGSDTDYTPEPPYIPPLAEPGHLSTVVQNLISAPLEEGVVPTFLSVLSTYIERETLPPAKHIHILLCLAREPGQPYANEQASPLSLLHKILSIHFPSNIARLLPIPGDPFRSKNPREKHDLWDAHGKIELDVRRRIRSCERDGVFGLLWRGSGLGQLGTRTGRGKRKRRGRDEENDEEEEVERVVDQDAWGVLEWLNALWRKDRNTYAEQHPESSMISPVFLQMLPRQSRDLQLDDLTLPLAALRSLATGQDNISSGSRQHIMETLFDLMIASVQGTTPPFHPPSLPLVFLPYLKESSLQSLPEILHALSTSAYPETVAHILTVYIEDLGGIRSHRTAIRRKVQSGMALNAAVAAVPGAGDSATSGPWGEGPFDLDPDIGNRWGSLKPPSLAYVMNDLLALVPASAPEDEEAEDARSRMDAAKECLMTIVHSSELELAHAQIGAWAKADATQVARWEESTGLSAGNDAGLIENVKAFLLSTSAA